MPPPFLFHCALPFPFPLRREGDRTSPLATLFATGNTFQLIDLGNDPLQRGLTCAYVTLIDLGNGLATPLQRPSRSVLQRLLQRPLVTVRNVGQEHLEPDRPFGDHLSIHQIRCQNAIRALVGKLDDLESGTVEALGQ